MLVLRPFTIVCGGLEQHESQALVGGDVVDQANTSELRVSSTAQRVPGRTGLGYTIVEFMMALAILAILVTLAVPAVQSGSDSSARNAVYEVMHLIDFARIQAQSRNRAYRLEIALQSDIATFTVDESDGGRCAADNFSAGIADVRTLALGSGDYVDVKLVGKNVTTALCFMPDGRVLDFDDGQPVDPDPSEAKYGAGVATLDIQQLSSASKTVGIRYRVLVPYNGVPSLIAGGS